MKDEIQKIKEEIEKKFENKKFWIGSIEGFEEIKANYEKTYLELQEKTIEGKIIYFLNKFPECKVECEIKTEKMPISVTDGNTNDRDKLNLQCFSANNNLLRLYFEKGDLLVSGFGRIHLMLLNQNSGIQEKEGIDYHIKHGDELLMTVSTKKKHVTKEMVIPYTSIGFDDCLEIKLGEKTKICNERDAIIQASVEAKIQHELELRQHVLSLKELKTVENISNLSESFVLKTPDDALEGKGGGQDWKAKTGTGHFLY